MSTQYPILVIGLEERVAEVLLPLLKSAAKITVMSTVEDYQSRPLGDGMYAAIFCGSGLSIPPVAIGMQLHESCARTPKFYITLDSKSFEAKRLMENGFDEVFLLPIDKEVLKKTIEEKVLVDTNEKKFEPLRIVDLEPGTRLDFDTYVFLPLNSKYVKYTFAGQEFDESKLAKLKQRQLNSLFIDHKDTNKFYQYVGRRLRALNDSTLPRQERVLRLRAAVRAIFTDMFDPSIRDAAQGASILETCQKIVSNYMTDGNSSDWYKRLMMAIGEVGDTYSHAMNVSTFAALFAIGIGLDNTKDLAVAGLLHDIGMTTLPESIVTKAEGKMTDEEKKLWQQHPEKTIAILKDKRVQLSPVVEAAIMQHQEKFNGSGYPKGLSGDAISLEAQLLSFADQFDYLTRFQTIHGLSSVDAFREIKRSSSINPELLEQIWPLLDKHKPPVVKVTA
jgi:HD-GYP domain-containing protein (c-di-GMP phosphodiesterase class II)